MFFSSSSLMEVDKEEIPEMQNPFQSEEDEEETSLGKRKISSIVKTEDEREVKRIAFFSQEPPVIEDDEEDMDMIEDYQEREVHRDIMEDNVPEEECVVDFEGFF
ncbi:hypothetical protein EUTSA_v10029085mg [Eutrema salsugineum]|uniref:Uncharacterized protein n=1 Tax=Eutrema salsugineum TaxID=72664 RepID=V4LEB5_EUTSA|nr:uncharacterized protein LOC18014459 [Eutrema salsugineum]ESQ38098.1 hypothetical protein EUTSA_v10029085mg [Eutrema salsugineum]